MNNHIDDGHDKMDDVEGIATMAMLMGFAVTFFSCLWWLGEVLRYVLDAWGPAGLASAGLLIGIGLMALGVGVLWVHSKNTGGGNA